MLYVLALRGKFRANIGSAPEQHAPAAMGRQITINDKVHATMEMRAPEEVQTCCNFDIFHLVGSFGGGYWGIMGPEQVRELLCEARRLYARRRAQSPDQPTLQDDAELLDLFGKVIAVADELLKERDQFNGRLRRTSIFTRPELPAIPKFPPESASVDPAHPRAENTPPTINAIEAERADVLLPNPPH